MKKLKTLNVVIEKTSTGYSAYTKRYTIVSTGKTIEEVKKNIVEAINYYFELTEFVDAEKQINYIIK